MAHKGGHPRYTALTHLYHQMAAFSNKGLTPDLGEITLLPGCQKDYWLPWLCKQKGRPTSPLPPDPMLHQQEQRTLPWQGQNSMWAVWIQTGTVK